MSKIFQGTRDQKTIFEELGNSLIFLFREHSRNIIGKKGDFVEVVREYGNTDPRGGPSLFIVSKRDPLLRRLGLNSG